MASILVLRDLRLADGFGPALAAWSSWVASADAPVWVSAPDTPALHRDHPVDRIRFGAPVASLSLGPVQATTHAALLPCLTSWAPEELSARMVAARHLVEQLHPDVVVLDSAPLSTLGLAGVDVPTIHLSTGLWSPAAPALWLDEPPEDERARHHAEQAATQALAAVQRAAEAAGVPVPDDLSAWGRADRAVIRGVEALDPLDDRGDAHHTALVRARGGACPEPPPAPGPPVLAVLDGQWSGFRAVVRAVRDTAAPVTLVAPTADPATDRFVHGFPVRRVVERVDLHALSEPTALGLVHSVHGVGQTLLANGVPIVVAPRHAEEAAVARAVAARTSAVTVLPASGHGPDLHLTRTLVEVMQDLPARAVAAAELAGAGAGRSLGAALQDAVASLS